MNRLIPVISACVAIVAVSARAEDASVSSGESRAQAQPHRDLHKSPFDSRLNLSLNGGLLDHKTTGNDRDREPAGGLLLHWNLLPMGDTLESRKPLTAGIHTGALWSNLSGNDLNSNAHVYMGPANLFVGYRLLPGLMLSAHGGMNVFYQPNAVKLDLGDSSIGALKNNWSAHPNAGLELSLGLTPGLALMARSDLTFTPVQDPFVGTLGLGVAL